MIYRLRYDLKRTIIILVSIFVLVLIAFRVAEIVRQEQSILPPQIYIEVLNSNGDVEQIELEELVIGIVAAEMPASFEDEALSAQAVAARTYVLSHSPPFGQGRHEEASVCFDSTCCQAYADDSELRNKWNENYDVFYAKISAAVLATKGNILTWQDNIAKATFCSTCGGHTEDAAACWGAEYPYLVAVDCRFCDHSPRYSGYQRLKLSEAASILKVNSNQLANIKVDNYTQGYRVNMLTIGESTYKGTEIRSLFELNSAAFNWLIIGDSIVFTTVGYGHGVGMCQYGADGMASRGYDYQEILAHYYPGTKLKKVIIEDNEN